MTKDEPDDFEGLTASNCAIACSANCCVITDEPVCGHPHKGGLAEGFVSRPAYIRRRQLAIDAIRRSK